jgi:hypothetical protein
MEVVKTGRLKWLGQSKGNKSLQESIIQGDGRHKKSEEPFMGVGVLMVLNRIQENSKSETARRRKWRRKGASRKAFLGGGVKA